jgi:carbonic anhydrase/acetyltransferase-like protein (isoleucine patch superfamily)
MLYRLGDDEPELIGEGHFIAPSADVIGRVKLHGRVSLWFSVVLRADLGESIEIGEGTNIQDGTVGHIEHGKSLFVGRNVTVGHKAILHGCTVGDNCLIGMGAVVLSGVRIGNNCIVGAHSLVTEGTVVPDNSLVLGSPGKVVRTLGEGALERIRRNGKGYEDLARQYLSELESAGS